MFKVNPIKSDKKFNTIILAAGFGSRLWKINKDIPKPMTIVDMDDTRGIDFLINKFRDVTDKFIVCTGYLAEILENHISDKFSDLNFRFVRQKPSELSPGPGKTAILGLRAVDKNLPTIILFCDILFEDQFSVEQDGLGLCKPGDKRYVLDMYKTVAIVDKGIIKDIVINKKLKTVKLNGWIGMVVCHDTKLLVEICDELLKEKDILKIDYSLDLIRCYVKRRRTTPIYLSKMYEFGTPETLNKLIRVSNSENK